jgi:predicted NBD/HSP70 family sugar kinase
MFVESEDVQRYSAQLDTPERRSTFAERLRDALCRETQSTSSTDSSYAVGISVAGSGLADRDIRCITSITEQ